MFKKVRETMVRFGAFSNEIKAEAYSNTTLVEATDFAFRNRQLLRLSGMVATFLFVFLAMMLGSADVVFASDITGGLADRINTQVRQIITALQGITSGVAALVILICFVMRMVSKNQRSVDEATTWLKRAAISLICINMIGFIIQFILNLAGNDQAIPT